jgi:PadR family transcriptional regulator, regulatory protein PadR
MKTKSTKQPAAEITERCSCAGTKLDRLLQPAILAILAAENLNGYRVGKKLETMLMFQERKPDASGMYRTLRELEHRGLIAPAAQKAQTPDAKVYRITALGAACLERWLQTLTNYQKTLGALLKDCESALSHVKALGPKGSRASSSCRCR